MKKPILTFPKIDYFERKDEEFVRISYQFERGLTPEEKEFADGCVKVITKHLSSWQASGWFTAQDNLIVEIEYSPLANIYFVHPKEMPKWLPLIKCHSGYVANAHCPFSGETHEEYIDRLFKR